MTYQDNNYPIALDYMDTRMYVSSAVIKGYFSGGTIYEVLTETNIREEFEFISASATGLYSVNVSTDKNVFIKDGVGGIELKDAREVVFNGIPAMVLTRVLDIDSSYQCGDQRSLIFLTPGFYTWFYCIETPDSTVTDAEGPTDPAGIEQEKAENTAYEEYYDRVDSIRQQSLKRFRWTQPIDTKSPEFLKWKEHIQEILRSQESPPADERAIEVNPKY